MAGTFHRIYFPIDIGSSKSNSPSSTLRILFPKPNKTFTGQTIYRKVAFRRQWSMDVLIKKKFTLNLSFTICLR